MSRLTATAAAPRTRYEGLVLWLRDERINLDTGEWSNCITLDRDEYAVIPPAHVCAQIGGGK